MKKVFSIFNEFNNFKLNEVSLSPNRMIWFVFIIIITIAVKFFLIPYNMMDMGDSATRVWNAWWWAEKPFFVHPESGHPFWFYFMGSIFKITGESYYTSAITMILLMTVAGIYLFKTVMLISDFKTAILTYFVFTLNPVIFRLNFEPYSQQTYLAAACIMIYYFVRSAAGDNSKRNFIIAGIFAFVGSMSRPEAIFVLVPFCIIAFLTKRKGCYYFIILALLFQVLWIGVSLIEYGTLLRTFESADQYTEPVNIHGLMLGLRLKGFFLPYYFLIFGITFVLFYFFIKGMIYVYKNHPKIIGIILFTPIIFPALVNGAAGIKSSIYHTTHYIYLMFFYSSIFTAFGISGFLSRIKLPIMQVAVSAVIILTCIPLSYIKDFVPEKYNHLFPKVIQFIATTQDPAESRKLIKFIDNNTKNYPSLIFDSQNSESSIYYVPYRTMFVPFEKVMISNYNITGNKEEVINYINDFMKRNSKGIVMYKKK